MDLLIGDIFRRLAAARPCHSAASLDSAVLTFAELDSRSERLAGALHADGIAHRDRVVWHGSTSLDAVVLFAALAKLGAVFVPVNPRATAAERDAIVRRAAPSAVLEAVPDYERRASAPRTEVSERDAHVVFFTSGSTGEPKGVVLTHRVNWLRSFAGFIPSSGATVCMFPLFHMASWTIALGCWQTGHEVAFVQTPSAGALLDAVERRRATRLYAIPAVWRRILEHGTGGHDLSSLREADTGTSATPPELLDGIKKALPHTVTRVFYGSTEAGPGTILADGELASKPGSVGLPALGVELRIDAGSGEVCLRSPFLFSGYLDDPAATAAALAGGWYHTGDVGTCDSAGYLSIIGRLRDVIRTGGETVAPAEVEAVLAAHPDIDDVAVVGVADADWGEVVCACVVPRHGATLDIADVRRHCEGRIAQYKHPRRLFLVDTLPRTEATGQVQRTLLAERAAAVR